MPAPRIFVSSTYYDLKHIRSGLEIFIKSFGYDPVLFESGNVFFNHKLPLDKSCYNELAQCQMLICVIGGSYGSAESTSDLTKEQKDDRSVIFNSVTKEEFKAAYSRKIPIYFFIESNVLSDYDVFKNNRSNLQINYPSVSNYNIFHFIDEVYSLDRGNYVCRFQTLNDITNWLTLQWAQLMCSFITEYSRKAEMQNLYDNIGHLNDVADTLKKYTEQILQKVDENSGSELIKSTRTNRRAHIFDLFKRSSLYEMTQNMGTTLTDDKLFEFLESSGSLEDFIEKAIGTDAISEKILMSNRFLNDAFINLKNSL